MNIKKSTNAYLRLKKNMNYKFLIQYKKRE